MYGYLLIVRKSITNFQFIELQMIRFLVNKSVNVNMPTMKKVYFMLEHAVINEPVGSIQWCIISIDPAWPTTLDYYLMHYRVF